MKTKVEFKPKFCAKCGRKLVWIPKTVDMGYDIFTGKELQETTFYLQCPDLQKRDFNIGEIELHSCFMRKEDEESWWDITFSSSYE